VLVLMEKTMRFDILNSQAVTRQLKVGLILALLSPLSLQADVSDLDSALATRETVPVERWFDGTVEAIHQATISSQTSGRIAAVNYDVDDYVEAGQELVRFSDVEQRTAHEAALAAGKETRARFLEASTEYDRANDLFGRQLGSKRDLDKAIAERDAARARTAGAEAAIESTRQQLEYTRVKAPYPGIVTERFVEVGESVTVGQPLMSGLSLDRLRVAVELPQRVTTLIRQQPEAVVMTTEGRVTPENITIFPIADPVSNTFRVRIDLPEGQFGLYPGMFVKTAFIAGNKERLLIPSAALLRRSEVTAVYVIGEDGVRLRQVRIGNTFGERVEVLAGITDGERVALDPVRAGIHVKSAAAQN
jgi:RND family efflux transporter MFP subunit